MQVNIKKIAKLISAKKWSAASELISEFTHPFRISLLEAELSTPLNGLKWIITSRESCDFVFNKLMSPNDYQFYLTRLILFVPLIKAFHSSKYFCTGNAFISLGDNADASGIALCSNREDSILVPDTDYLSSYGYQQSRLDFLVNSPPWNMRIPVAFWRGSTTGMRKTDEESWRSLPRLELCKLSATDQSLGLLDVGVTSFHQVSKREEREIRAAGYAKNFSPISLNSKYKYQIDIDGNTNAWSALFQKLLSGSAVLKIASPHNFRQWYYDELVPWVNYVPVKSDMSDLVEKIHWLIDHDDEAMRIGINGRKLASKLTYDEELNKALINIHKALK